MKYEKLAEKWLDNNLLFNKHSLVAFASVKEFARYLDRRDKREFNKTINKMVKLSRGVKPVKNGFNHVRSKLQTRLQQLK